MQIRWEQLQTTNDFQRLLGDIFHLWHAIGIKLDQLINLDGDQDLNLSSPRELTAETKRELALMEEKLQVAYVKCVYLQLNYILVILPTKHFPAGTSMQREDIIIIELILFNT